MRKIQLNKKEYNYLSWAQYVPKSFRTFLLSAQQFQGGYLWGISEDQADEIRDICAEQLQLVGFDENYALTSEGIILESIIDKFFIG